MTVINVGIISVLSSLGLFLAVAGVQSSLSRQNIVIARFPDASMNFSTTETVNKLSPPPAQLPEFELFDPPNLYVYHDYVSQGLPKFMTDVELSTGTQRMIFILHWSVRYFLVIFLVLGMLQ